MSLKSFEPLEFPLDGQQLVEASAGTGKTFSLAGLFLRLLLEKQLDISEILVITFTHAATQELRARIRARLVDAAAIAADPNRIREDNAEDALAQAIIQRCETSEDRANIARRLKDAALRIDEAAISTIHGFAHRAVAEHAFYSGLPFDRGEQVDDASVYAEVTADYWRKHALGADSEEPFLEWWSSPDTLLAALSELNLKPHTRLNAKSVSALNENCAELMKLWQQDGAGFCDAMRDFWDNNKLKKQPLKKALLKYDSIEDALAALRQAIDSGDVPPRLPEWTACLHNASRQFTKKALDEGEAFLAAPLPELLRKLQPQARQQALRIAHEAITRMADERKRQRRQFSFADMISALHEAVCDPQQGPALCQSLHAEWPWMLVDEFQDTDPRQYEILRRIHAAGEQGGLLLIGDPKQAIYGFRGGDVFAYLKAVADSGDQRFNLTHNYRSTAEVIKATETLFRVPGDQAFLVDGIEYQTVSAGRSDIRKLMLDGRPEAGLNFWWLNPEKPKKADAVQSCLDATVAKIVTLLDPETPAEIHREKESDGQQEITRGPVRPRDIAVLVNTNNQAADTQRALARVGVASVCVHQQSVFATDEASELLRVLLAAENPTDEPLIRGALATRLMGFRLGELINLQSDDNAWQVQIDRFQSGLESWRRHGVLALLQPLIQAAAARLLAWEDGERRVSNYLQIAELLASAEEESFGTAGLLIWLREGLSRAEENRGKEAEQLRLESDEALVRIATVHRAKGLEYPIVFLPFAPWLGGMGKPDKPPFSYHDRNGRALIEIDDEDAARWAAISEARGEGIRQLYVALTRAEIACYLPWGAVTGSPNSALASLLHRHNGIHADFWTGSTANANPLNHALVDNALTALQDAADGSIAVRPLPEPARSSIRLTDDTQAMRDARTDFPPPALPWSVFSFTRLVRSSESGIASAGAQDETEPTPQATDGDEVLPDLPGGPGFGSAIHDLLEQAVKTDNCAQWAEPPPENAPQREQVRAALRRYGMSLDGEQAEKIVEGAARLVSQALFSPLPGLGNISDLPVSSLRTEMEFMFRLRGSQLRDFHAALIHGGYARNLPMEQTGLLLRGLMHGFIDLVAEKDGRYFVIDYKTNWLGNQAGNYAETGLASAIAHHHYDLQYVLYQIALHRFLRRRLADYDPEHHLGGVRYLFLRGMSAQSEYRGVFQDQPDTATLLKLDAILDDEKEAVSS